MRFAQPSEAALLVDLPDHDRRTFRARVFQYGVVSLGWRGMILETQFHKLVQFFRLRLAKLSS